MIKMPCLFVRDFPAKHTPVLTEVVTPGCEWVLAGEGTASVKRDGTSCMFRDGQLFKRYDAKMDRKTGELRAAPPGAIPCGDPDTVTGHWPHWAPIVEQDYWHAEALARQRLDLVEGATYELCGPKIGPNPERLEVHTLIRHGDERCSPLRTFDGLREHLIALPRPIEGIVFAHPDGRHAKIRRNDYGLAWPAPD